MDIRHCINHGRFLRTHPAFSAGPAHPEDVLFISEPGGYIDRFTSKAPNPKHKPIGFQSGGEWP